MITLINFYEKQYDYSVKKEETWIHKSTFMGYQNSLRDIKGKLVY